MAKNLDRLIKIASNFLVSFWFMVKMFKAPLAYAVSLPPFRG
jgi:hypothetical protein